MIENLDAIVAVFTMGGFGGPENLTGRTVFENIDVMNEFCGNVDIISPFVIINILKFVL